MSFPRRRPGRSRKISGAGNVPAPFNRSMTNSSQAAISIPTSLEAASAPTKTVFSGRAFLGRLEAFHDARATIETGDLCNGDLCNTGRGRAVIVLQSDLPSIVNSGR